MILYLQTVAENFPKEPKAICPIQGKCVRKGPVEKKRVNTKEMFEYDLNN